MYGQDIDPLQEATEAPTIFVAVAKMVLTKIATAAKMVRTRRHECGAT